MYIVNGKMHTGDILNIMSSKVALFELWCVGEYVFSNFIDLFVETFELLIKV